MHPRHDNSDRDCSHSAHCPEAQMAELKAMMSCHRRQRTMKKRLGSCLGAYHDVNLSYLMQFLDYGNASCCA